MRQSNGIQNGARHTLAITSGNLPGVIAKAKGTEENIGETTRRELASDPERSEKAQKQRAMRVERLIEQIIGKLDQVAIAFSQVAAHSAAARLRSSGCFESNKGNQLCD